MTIYKSSITFFIVSVFYKLLLEAAYVLFVNDRYAYAGFKLDVQTTYYITSFIFCLFAIWVTPKSIKSPSAFFMHVMLFSWLIPFFSFSGLTASPLKYQAYMLMSFFLIAMMIRTRFSFPYLKLNTNYIWGIAIILVAIVTANFLQPSSLQYMNFDIRKVYDFRDLAGEVTNQGLFSYLNKWAFKLLGPLLIVLSLYKKNYILVTALVGLHLFWFSVSGHKSVLFYPFVSIFIYLIYNSSVWEKIGIIPIALSIVVSISLWIYLVFDYGFIASLFVRRVFFVPVSLAFEYYRFFDDTGFLFWSYKTPLLASYPYDVTPARVIGAHLGNPETNANNSFFSTGYMNAGLAGMLIYSFLFSIILTVLDKLYRSGVPMWAVVGITINPIHSIIKSADLITGIVTHGLGLTIVFLYLLAPYFYRRSYT